MRCNMMSLSGFLGVQVDVLIDEAAAAELERYDEVQQRAPARKGESRSHTHWQESEGWIWEEEEGRADLLYCMCSNSGPCVHRGKHHSVFQGPSFLCQTLRASTMSQNPHFLELLLLFFSLFLSFSLSPFSPSLPLLLDHNTSVIYSSWSAGGCVCSVLFKGRVPQPSSVLALVHSS